jgi:hypothetical protein
MTDLKKAAQQALEALEFMADEWGFTQKANRPERWQAIEALRAALAQQDEPKGGGKLPPPLQAEPVLVVEKEPDYMSRGHFYEGSKPFIDPTEVWKLPIGTKLYAQPPRREWRGLTDDEISALFPLPLRSDYKPYSFARAVEAALKEKNNG